MSMFYSQLLLSKKGLFGTVWVAAHSHKKLKKDQIFNTNISSSVDKILKDGVPTITYRILAYLLLGVVRIYSRKVEYLFHDCRGVLTEICHFSSKKLPASRNLEGTCVPEPTRKKRAITSSVEAICAPYSVITLPERFELDSFDLELVDHAKGDHFKSREDITLKDSWEDGRSGHLSLEKECYLKNYVTFEDRHETFEDYHVTFEDHHETFSPSPEFRCIPSPASMEKLQDDNTLLLEDRLDPMILSEGEEESEFGAAFDKDHRIGRDRVKFLLPEMMVEERSEIQVDGTSYEAQCTIKEKGMPSEMNSEVTEKLHDSPDHYPVSITIDATPESKMPTLLDAGPILKASAFTPESLAVRTPAPREPSRRPRKRKCTCDDSIVVPNNVFKGWIDDWSDLVCKRRKVRHTTKHVWKVDRMSNLPQCFLEPLLPIPPIDLKSLTNKKLKILEPPETRGTPAKSDGLDPIKTSVAPAKLDAIGSPSRGFLEEEIIAPSTPITHSTSVRFSELRLTTKSTEVGPAISFESTEQNHSLSDNRDLDTVLIEEEEDVNSYQENEQSDEWSARTRNVAGYLHKNFADREKSGKEESLTLFEILNGKTRKESARLFYELLVMKTGGYVDVKQEKAYGDISVKECDKLKKACDEAADVSSYPTNISDDT